MKKKTAAVLLILAIVLLTSCQTGGGDAEQQESALYTQTITLCVLNPGNSSSLENILPIMSQRLEHMGYGGSCAVSGDDISLSVTSDHEIMRDEREEIIRRMCMSGELTFDDSDGNH